MFISFEGCEGSGKSTQSQKLYEYFVSKKIPCVKTREIGGTEIAEKIRDIVLHNDISKNTELLLIMAARNDHIEKVIKPALSEKKIVICDRFIDSTAAYQGETEEEIKKIFYLDKFILGGLQPDKTFYLKLDPETGLKRALSRGDANKYEDKDLIFHKKVAKNYDFLAQTFTHRIQIIDAVKQEEEIFQDILGHLAI